MAFYSHQLLTSDLFKTFLKASISGSPRSSRDEKQGHLYRVRRAEALEAFHHLIQSVDALTRLVQEARRPDQGAGLSLVLPSQLMLGIVRIHHAQSVYLVQDCEHALVFTRPPSAGSPATKKVGKRSAHAADVLLPNRLPEKRARLELQMPEEEDILGQGVMSLQAMHNLLLLSKPSTSLASSLMDRPALGSPAGLMRAGSAPHLHLSASFPAEDELFDVATTDSMGAMLDVLSEEHAVHEEEEEHLAQHVHADRWSEEQQPAGRRRDDQPDAEPSTPQQLRGYMATQPPTAPFKSSVQQPFTSPHQSSGSRSMDQASAGAVRRRLFTQPDVQDEVWDELYAQVDMLYEAVQQPGGNTEATQDHTSPALNQEVHVMAGSVVHDQEGRAEEEPGEKLPAAEPEAEQAGEGATPGLPHALVMLLASKKRLKQDQVDTGHGLLPRAEFRACLDDRSSFTRTHLMTRARAHHKSQQQQQQHPLDFPLSEPPVTTLTTSGSSTLLPHAKGLLHAAVSVLAPGQRYPLSTVLACSGLMRMELRGSKVSKVDDPVNHWLASLLHKHPTVRLAPQMRGLYQHQLAAACAGLAEAPVENAAPRSTCTHQRQPQDQADRDAGPHMVLPEHSVGNGMVVPQHEVDGMHEPDLSARHSPTGSAVTASERTHSQVWLGMAAGNVCAQTDSSVPVQSENGVVAGEGEGDWVMVQLMRDVQRARPEGKLACGQQTGARHPEGQVLGHKPQASKIALTSYLPGASRLQAARLFVNSLALMSCGVVHLEQAQTDILISPSD